MARQAFGIYAIGFLMRPVAGMIVAHHADRVGRKRLVVLAILLMSIPTFLMGLLPTYAVAGWAAPVALLVLRILQGCAVGGLACSHVHALLAGQILALFPTPMRHSGFALPYSIGIALFTGLMPLMLSWLVQGYSLSAPLCQCLLGCAAALALAAPVRLTPQHLGGEVPPPGAILSQPGFWTGGGRHWKRINTHPGQARCWTSKPALYRFRF